MSKSTRLPDVRIPRNIRLEYDRFTDYFRGFERVPAVKAIFGPKTKAALRSLKVEFFSSRWGFMGVSDADGHLMVSTHYLRTGEPREIYLDIVHELVHVRQFREGMELFEDGFEYPDLPTEIEAYKTCVAEGRRLGMSDLELYEYLKVFWMSEKEVRRLARNVGIRPPPAKPRKPRAKR